MAKIEFDYEAWNPKKDILLDRPGNTAGYAVIHAGLRLSKVASGRVRDREPGIKDGLEGVIQLLAGALEWCRWYGLTAAEVQGKVKAYILKNKESNLQAGLMSIATEIEEFSQAQKPTGRSVDPTVVVS